MDRWSEILGGTWQPIKWNMGFGFLGFAYRGLVEGFVVLVL